MRLTFLHVSFSVRRKWFWQLVAWFKNTPTPHTCSSPVLVTFCRGEHTDCDSDSRSQGGLGTWRMNDCIKHWSAENVFISEICLFTWVKLQFIWLCHSYFFKMCFFFDPVLYLFFLNVKFLNLGRRQITKPCRSKPLSSGIIFFFFLRTLNSHIHIECLEYSEAVMIRARLGPRFRNFQIFIFNMPIQGFLWKLSSSTGKGKKMPSVNQNFGVRSQNFDSITQDFKSSLT